MADKSRQIEAAGAVVISTIQGVDHVLVVHRPHRQDWSLPKGKLEPGEAHDSAAVREVHEETGIRCALGPFLGTRSYEVNGEPKTVHYWRATVVDEGQHNIDDEVDEVRWVPCDEVGMLLTYADDRDLVTRALSIPATQTLIVLRHAEAMKRAVWKDSGDADAGFDSARPLTAAGLRQADQLAQVLANYRPATVVSSDARRCVSTVSPYAESVGLLVQTRHALSEEGFQADPDQTAACVRELLMISGPTVWCTHRPVLPAVTRALTRDLKFHEPATANDLDPRLKPSAALILHLDNLGHIVQIDRRNEVPERLSL
mgnify:CR=1 FL=1